MTELQRIESDKLGRKCFYVLTQSYDVPSGKFLRRFVGMISVELDRICARKWIYDSVIVFQSVIL